MKIVIIPGNLNPTLSMREHPIIPCSYITSMVMNFSWPNFRSHLPSGAIDILERYFERIGGRPAEPSKMAQKKRGRKSMTSETPEPKAKKAKAGANGSSRGRRGSDADDMDSWPTSKGRDNWTPPRPTKDAWEDLIISVETIEVEDNGTKWAFLLWAQEDEHGKKRTSKALLTSVYKAAPQAVSVAYTFPSRTKGTDDVADAQVLRVAPVSLDRSLGKSRVKLTILRRFYERRQETSRR